jgi:hypothetical protein
LAVVLFHPIAGRWRPACLRSRYSFRRDRFAPTETLGYHCGEGPSNCALAGVLLDTGRGCEEEARGNGAASGRHLAPISCMSDLKLKLRPPKRLASFVEAVWGWRFKRDPSSFRSVGTTTKGGGRNCGLAGSATWWRRGRRGRWRGLPSLPCLLLGG